jgi:hypothetical protein
MEATSMYKGRLHITQHCQETTTLTTSTHRSSSGADDSQRLLLLITSAQESSTSVQTIHSTYSTKERMGAANQPHVATETLNTATTPEQDIQTLGRHMEWLHVCLPLAPATTASATATIASAPEACAHVSKKQQA